MGTSRFTGALTIGAGDVSDQQVASNAAISTSKLKHAYMKGTNFALAIGGTPVTREEVVHVCGAAGTILGFHSMLNDSGSSTAITFDLKKNGVSVLSSAISQVHGDGDRTVMDGTISSATVAEGDVLSILMTVSSATGAQGPFAWVNIEENAAPA